MSSIDPVELIYALAALVTAFSLLRYGPRVMKHLTEINGAVNNVDTDPDTGEKAPPLWKRIDGQTAAIGRVEGKLDTHIDNRTIHRTPR